MKKKAAVIGLVCAMALGTCTVSAANGTKNISATFRNIKIVVDGKEVSTSAEPFIYNGTTYLPIRAVGEAVGKEVTWNAGTNTVYLGEVPAGAQQPAAPEAPAAAGTPDLPVLRQFVEDYTGDSLSREEAMKTLSENISKIRAGEESVRLAADSYRDVIWPAVNDGNTQRARDAYAGAQILFSYLTDGRDYAEVKADFEDFWQNDILPNL